MTRTFNPIRVHGNKSEHGHSSAVRGSTGRFQRTNRRMVILMFPNRASAGDLSNILAAMPNGTVVTGTHYNSEKSQYGLILSHWTFDPIEHGEKIPECRAVIDTEGVQFEVLNIDTYFFEPAKWQYIDARTWVRKIFDYFFN